MSLINQVLQDLETRRGAPVVQTAGPVLEDLRPVMGGVPSPSRAKQWIVLGVILAAVGAVFAWHRWPELAGVALNPPVPTTVEENWTADASPPMVSSPVMAPPPMAGTARPEAPAESAAETAATRLTEFQSQAMSGTTEPETGEAQTLTNRMEVSAAGQKSADTVRVNTAPMITKPEPAAAPPVAKVEPESIPVRAEAPRPSNEAKPERPATAALRTPPRKPIVAPKRPAPAAAASKNETHGVMQKTARPLTAHEQAENAYREGAKNLQRRLVTAAEKDLKAALVHDPKHVKARELLVGMLLREGRRDEAQALLKAGLDEVPGQASFTLLLARLYFDRGAENEALELLEAARGNVGRNADYQNFLATLYQRAGRHGEAVTAYRRAIGLRPTEGKWWLGMAISLEAQGDSVNARDAYRRAARSGDLDGKLLAYAQERIGNIKQK